MRRSMMLPNRSRENRNLLGTGPHLPYLPDSWLEKPVNQGFDQGGAGGARRGFGYEELGNLELARGSVSDRPWGQTLAALGLRGLTGQLALAADDGKRYVIAFERGAVVGASSPLPTDSVIRAALTNHLISSSQVAEISRKLASHPDRDEFDVMVEATGLAAEQAFRLRQRLIAQRAARTFSIDRGKLRGHDSITIPVGRRVRGRHSAPSSTSASLNLSGQAAARRPRQPRLPFHAARRRIDDIPQSG